MCVCVCVCVCPYNQKLLIDNKGVVFSNYSLFYGIVACIVLFVTIGTL